MAAASGVFKGVARHSLVYGIGLVLGRLVGFLMLPIYTRYLSPADYGVIALIEMTLDFITIFAGGRLIVGYFHFHHLAGTDDDRRAVASTAFLLIAGLYAVVGGVVVAVATPLSQLIFGHVGYGDVIRVAAANVAVQSLTLVPLSLARVTDRSVLYVATNLAKLVLSLGLNVWFVVYLHLGIRGVFYSNLVANLVVGVAMTAWFTRQAGWQFKPVLSRKLLGYGLPLIFTSIATFIVTFGDRYFLKASADETVVGLYNLAYTFGFLLVTVGFTPVDQAWGPRRFELAQRPDGKVLLARGFLLMNVVLLTVGVGIGVLVEDVIRIMTTPAFHSAAQVVPVILIAYVFESWAGTQDIGILVRERTGLVNVANWVSAAIALAAYALLIPRFGAWGAAWATVFAFAARAALMLRLSQRLFPIPYRWRPVVLLCGWAGAIVGLAIALPTLPLVSSLAIRAGLLVVYGAGLWWLPILDAEDRDGVRAVVRRVLSRQSASEAA